MNQLSDPAIKAILKEWRPKEYYPPHTDVQDWIHSIESLCNVYGIPDVQRLQCAVGFIKEELSIELRRVLVEARERFGLVDWTQFKAFLVAFDQDFREEWKKFPFYKKHPRFTAVGAVGVAGALIIGGIALAPIIAHVLPHVGLGSVGFAAGSTVVTYQSIAYASATRVLISSLQSAGTTMVMSSVGTILTGAATTGAGILVASNARPRATSANSKFLQRAAESIADGDNPDDDKNRNPPPCRAAAPEEYLLTPRAILAIVKSWDVGTYNPPGTDCASWLGEVHNVCERYEIPTSQRARCAAHRMRADCKEAAHAAGCYKMAWDDFAVWLLQYDYEGGSANGNIAKPLKGKSKM